MEEMQQRYIPLFKFETMWCNRSRYVRKNLRANACLPNLCLRQQSHCTHSLKVWSGRNVNSLTRVSHKQVCTCLSCVSPMSCWGDFELDSTTTVTCINSHGRTWSSTLHAEAIEIMEWDEKNFFSTRAVHTQYKQTKGELNQKVN